MSIPRRPLVWAGVLAAMGCLAAAVEFTPGIPNIFSKVETELQAETHFLVFTGSDTAGESATTSKAYYNAIDPTGSKRTFPEWLVKTGFIQNTSQWHATGVQRIACDLPGCDLPSHQADGSLTYGDNIINTDSHAIVLNAADLGFVRNQFIRCVPNCSAPNPIIYTYLENYPVNPFANTQAVDTVTGLPKPGSGFPFYTGYPSDAEARAAIASALTRPPGNLPGCTAADTPFGCKISRIADVAFEWAPPATNPSSSTRFGQLYAFIFDESTATPTETIAASPPIVGSHVLDNVTNTLDSINAGDPFPPNLDFLGFKEHPGVCFICHGGNPKNLTSTGAYPNQGNVNGFRFLPLDIRNLLFTSDAGADQPGLPTSTAFTDRASQESHIKAYNLAVLKTVPTRASTDEQGTLRVAHLREVITGWYAGFPGDQTMSGALQHDFVPAGWKGSPAQERLYNTVIAPSCRSCHFNRELTLDFGTVANFDSYRQGVLELTLLPLCQSGNPPAGKRPMPLAHLTYQRFWQANATARVLPSGADGPLTLQNTADQIAQHFGYTSAASYCSQRP